MKIVPINRSNSAHSEIRYRAYLDVMRAIAILGVLFYHSAPVVIPGGYYGVDIFFVISGFIITKSILSMHFENLGSALRYFWQRRINRLMPVLLTCCMVTGLLVAVFIPPDVNKGMFQIAFGSLLALGNILLIEEGLNYFSFDAEFNPFTHTWSLGVEEQFYLFIPVLLFVICNEIKSKFSLALLKSPTLRSFSFGLPVALVLLILFFFNLTNMYNKISILIFGVGLIGLLGVMLAPVEAFTFNKVRSSRALLRVVFLVVPLGLSLLFLSFTSRESLQGFYSIFCRFWELAIGVILCLFLPNLMQSMKNLGVCAPSARLFLIVAPANLILLVFFFPWFASGSDVMNRLFVVLSTTTIIIMREFSYSIDFEQNIRMNILTQTAKRMTTIASSIGVLSYSLYIWHWPLLIISTWLFVELDATLLVYLLSMIFAISYISHRFLEKPFIACKLGLKAGTQVLILTIVTALLSLLFLAVSNANLNTRAFYLFPTLISKFPTNHLVDYDCHGLIWNTENEKRCLLSESDTKGGRIFVFGDSHALHLLPAIEHLAAKYQMKMGYFTGGPVLSSSDALRSFLEKQLVAEDLVIISQQRSYSYEPALSVRDYELKQSHFNFDGFNTTTEAFYISLAEIGAVVENIGANLLLVKDTPQLKFDYVSGCVQQEFLLARNSCDVSEDLSLDHRVPLDLVFDRVAGQYKKVHTWDPHPYLCRDGKCRYEINTEIVYFDSGHLTRNGALLLAKPLESHFSDRLMQSWE